MAIAFPRAVPSSLKVVGLSFMPERVEELTPTRGGEQLAIDLGPPLWRGTWQSAPLKEEAFGEVRAWFDTLASAQAFYGFDNLRRWPVAYPRGFDGLLVSGSPFDGVAYLVDVDDNNVEMTLGGLPVGFILKAGDYVAFDYAGNKRALHRIAAGGVADGDGVMTIEVRPHIRQGWDVGSPVTSVMLATPAAKMVVVPKSYSETIDPNRLARVSFEAVQTL